MKIAFFISCLLMTNLIYGQATIKVEVSSDTVRVGELVEVKYTFENGEGQFTSPDLTGLLLISGPNVSSSFMIANGKKSSSQTYTYIFRPVEEGQILLPQATYTENEKTEIIGSVLITVVTNTQSSPSKSTSTNTSKII